MDDSGGRYSHLYHFIDIGLLVWLQYHWNITFNVRVTLLYDERTDLSYHVRLFLLRVNRSRNQSIDWNIFDMLGKKISLVLDKKNAKLNLVSEFGLLGWWSYSKWRKISILIWNQHSQIFKWTEMIITEDIASRNDRFFNQVDWKCWDGAD